ncbi:MAG: stage III sporulation protein AD, partial [Turicibacter sanguinis]
MLLEEVNPKYAKGFSLVLLTFFFMVALQILSKMIGDLTAVFLNFNIEQQYVTIIIRLIGIVYYAEFVNFLLTEAKLGNVGKMFEYIVKLYLIGYSLPMIITL